jgi:hypothetical protein
VIGGWGSPELGALMDEGWIDAFGETDPNLIGLIVHEVEHAMGRSHVSETVRPIVTPNQQLCGGY